VVIYLFDLKVFIVFSDFLDIPGASSNLLRVRYPEGFIEMQFKQSYKNLSSLKKK